MLAKLLLKEDVEALGRKGEFVTVKPGYARNFLLPQGLAVIADKQALRVQQRLIVERKAQAVIDQKESEELAARLNGIVIQTTVKVDHEGHMYGSVSAHDLAEMLEKEHRLIVAKRSFLMKHPIKKLGNHTITVRLKEDITATFTLKIKGEGVVESILVEAPPVEKGA